MNILQHEFCIKNKVRCFKNNCLNKLFEFFREIYSITTHNIAQINIITPNYAYYIIIQLTLKYEYPITVFFSYNINRIHLKLQFKKVI
jgi:hypothetical protein